MKTVLIIEDQLEIASILRLLVSRGGHRALLASNISDANAIWRALKGKIDLVVSDIQLPDGSGVHFVNLLRSEKPFLPVIITSGVPDPAMPPGSFRVDKPFKIAEFAEVLETALQSGRCNSEPGGPSV